MKASKAKQRWEDVRKAARAGDPSEMMDAVSRFEGVADTMLAYFTNRGRLRAELDDMAAYALAATKAITGLTPNGSEFFGPELGGIYTANLELCESVIREQRQLAYERWLKATAELDATKAEIEKLQAALWQCKENAEGAMLPSSVIHAIVDEALKGQTQ